MEEENKKKTMLPIIVGVITLLVLVIGATYAYFTVGLSNNFGTTTISANAENVGTVTLSNINSTLSMNLTAADMMRKSGEVCELCNSNTHECEIVEECPVALKAGFTCSCNNGYVSSTYYATPMGKSTTENMAWEIGRATVSPNTDTNYYSCDYTLSITTSGTTNMYTAFNNMPEEANATQARPNAYKSSEQVIFQINDTTYDWYEDGMPSTYTGNMIVSKDNPGHITAGLKLVNKDNIDQTDLAGTDVSISIQATNFSCSAVPVTYNYYNAGTWNDGDPILASSPGNMSYYIKKITINNSVVNNEVCAVIGTTEVCVKPNDWENRASYYTKFTTAGATCTYYDNNSDGINDTLQCSINDTNCIITEDEILCNDSSSGLEFCSMLSGSWEPWCDIKE